MRANNHRTDVRKPDTILAYFQERNHILNKQAKFIMIVQLTNTTKSKNQDTTTSKTTPTWIGSRVSYLIYLFIFTLFAVDLKLFIYTQKIFV